MKLSANIARLVSALVRNSVAALSLSTLVAGGASISTAATAATGCPPCPKGWICAYKDAEGPGDQVVCKKPIIIPDCKDSLCGISNTKGPQSLRAK